MRARTWARIGAGGVTLLPLVLLACTGSGKRESAALEEAIDRYRAADDASKSARAESVAALACTEATVCAAKRICLDAIGPTTRALLLKDEVTRRLGDLEQKQLAPDSVEAQALPDKLDEAAHMLQEGRAKMTECDRKLVDLRVLYGG